MKLCVALSIAFVCTVPVSGQRGGHGGGRSPAYAGPGVVHPARPNPGYALPPVAPIPPLSTTFPARRVRREGYGHAYGFPGFYAASPFLYADAAYWPAATAPQNVIIINQPAPAELPVEVPAPPAKPEIREYSFGPSTTESAESAFAIVLKDGSTRSAAAVWTHDDSVEFIDAEGRRGRVLLGDINRRATMRVNSERHLRLQLPPARAR